MYFLWDFRYCGKPPREITRFEEVAPPRRSGRSRRRPPPEALPPPGSAAFSPGLCRPHPLGAGGQWRIPDPPRAGRSSRVRRRPATPVRCSADSGRWRSLQPESPRSPGTPGLLPRCRLSGRNRRRKPPVPFDDTVFSAPPANERTAPGSHGRRTGRDGHPAQMVTWPSPRGRPPRPLHSCPPLRTALPTRSPRLTNSTSRQFRALPNRLSTSRALWQVSSRNTGRPYRSRTAGRTDSEGHICSPPGRQGRSAAKPMARTPAVPDSILSNSLRAVSRRTASGASFGRSVPARRNTRRSSPHRTLSQRPGRNATPAAFGASGESRRRTGFRPGSSLHTTSLSRRTSPSIISPTILEMVILLKPVLTTRSRRVRHAPVATMRRTIRGCPAGCLRCFFPLSPA